MGMRETDFLLMSPRTFYNKFNGFNQLRQAEYELVRLQTVELLNVQIKNRIKNPSQLWRFPWEKKSIKVDKESAKHRAKRAAEKIDRIEKRHGTNDRDIII